MSRAGVDRAPDRSADATLFRSTLLVTAVSLAGMWALMAATAALWPSRLDLSLFGFTARVGGDGSSSVTASPSVLVLLVAVPALAVAARRVALWRRGA